MKNIKDYKGALIMYFIFCIICVAWIICYDRPNINKNVKVTKRVVYVA